jgi:hypothetical protein
MDERLASLAAVGFLLAACATDRASQAVSSAVEPEDSTLSACKPGVQASVCYQLAFAMVDTKNPNPSPAGAFELFSAACIQGFAPSCKVLEGHFAAPRPLRPAPGQAARPTSGDAAARQSVVRCNLRLDGTLDKCTVLRLLGPPDVQLVKACHDALYAPGRLDGIPFESTVFVRFGAVPTN